MDYAGLLDILKGMSPIVGDALMILGGLVVVGGVYVRLTPNKKDDAWFAALEAKPIVGDLLKALVRFSPIVRK